MPRPALFFMLAFAWVPAGAQETEPAAKPIHRPPALGPASTKLAETEPVTGRPAEPKPANDSRPEESLLPAHPAESVALPESSPPAGSAAAASEVTAPPAPADRIWDQTGKWAPAERKVAADELNAAAVQLRFSVFLVNLNAAPDEQAADLAKRLLYSWKGTADRAVILTGPGLQPPVLIESEGESLGSIPEEQLIAFHAAARAEAARVPAGLAPSLAAARSLISQMNSFRAGGTLGPTVPVALVVESGEENPGNIKLLWLALGAISTVVVLAAAFFMKREQTSALVFPPVSFRARFSAPHSGGNNALISFSASAPPGQQKRQ